MNVNIRVNRNTAAVHRSRMVDSERIDFPVCGAPGNTPAAYRSFRPVVTDEAVTCKRCAKAVASTEPTAAPAWVTLGDGEDAAVGDAVRIGNGAALWTITELHADGTVALVDELTGRNRRITTGRLVLSFHGDGFLAARFGYTCSYCTTDATHVGAGHDGDFYCSAHVGRAPGACRVGVRMSAATLPGPGWLRPPGLPGLRSTPGLAGTGSVASSA